MTKDTDEPHARRVADYYDENTEPFYLKRWHPEDIHFGLFPPGSDARDHFLAVKRMTEAIARPAAIGPGHFVVDAGCGVGGAAVDIARRSGAKVLGLTISEFQVRTATGRADVASLSHRAVFERADCSRRIPCEDASVDVVVTIEAACHFRDKPRFLAECRRVLRPGGRLVGTDWMAGDSLSDADYQQHLAPVCDSWRRAGLESLATWRRMIEDAGLTIEECEDLGADVLPNAAILARGRQELLLEVANGCHSPETAGLWQQQYDSLVRAWVGRYFTIGRFAAVAS